MNTVDPSKNPQIERIREFLAALNSGGAPIESQRYLLPTPK